jgi:hypothetical protein
VAGPHCFTPRTTTTKVVGPKNIPQMLVPLAELSAPIHFGRNDRNVGGRFGERLAIAPLDGKRLERLGANLDLDMLGRLSPSRRRTGYEPGKTYPYLSLVILLIRNYPVYSCQCYLSYSSCYPRCLSSSSQD